MFALIRFVVALCLVVGIAWAAVSLEIDGRTPAEHAVERAQDAWAELAADAGIWAKDLADSAWDRVTEAFTGGPDPTDPAPSTPAAAPPTPKDTETVEVARQRVARLEAARRDLEAAGSPEASESPAGTPDRPASSVEREALERRLRTR